MILAMLHRFFPALHRGVTRCVACNLCCNGAINLRDKLQEKLPSVPVPLGTDYVSQAGSVCQDDFQQILHEAK